MTLASTEVFTKELAVCPVYEVTERGEWEPCEAALIPMVTKFDIGDDYGGYPHFSIAFPCGHSVKEMERFLNAAVDF